MFKAIKLEIEYIKFRILGKKSLKNSKIVSKYVRCDTDLLKNRWNEIFSMKRNFKKKIKFANELNCKVGRCTYCDRNVFVGSDKTEIGSFCSIGNNVLIGPGEHALDYLSTSSFFYLDLLGWNYGQREVFLSPCSIGNDVWIASNVFIKAGVKIGDGAVCAAGAVVTKDVPPYAIVGGVPAKVIRYRFDDVVIGKLLKYKWWNLEDCQIKKLDFHNINKCLNQLEEYIQS